MGIRSLLPLPGFVLLSYHLGLPRYLGTTCPSSTITMSGKVDTYSAPIKSIGYAHPQLPNNLNPAVVSQLWLVDGCIHAYGAFNFYTSSRIPYVNAHCKCDAIALAKVLDMIQLVPTFKKRMQCYAS